MTKPTVPDSLPEEPTSMQRPAGVTALALIFFLFGAFVLSVGVVILISPQALSNTFILLRGFEMGGAHISLLVGTIWALIGWGLFGLHDWARLAAMIVIISGVGILVVRLAMTASLSHRSLAWGALEILARLAMCGIYSGRLSRSCSRSRSQ